MKLELSDKKEVCLLERAIEVYRDYVEWRLDWNNEDPFRPKEMIELTETTQKEIECLIEKLNNLRD